MTVEFPKDVSPVHFLKLELTDAAGKAVSENFYWRSAKDYKRGRTWTGPQFEGFEDLAKLPKVALDSKVTWGRDGNQNTCTATVRNPSTDLAFLVWLRLQHADTAKPVRPAFYDDNFFSLLPGESRTIRIDSADTAARSGQTQLRIDGWNVEAKTFRQ
jgi:mannosylglycoprotein endo-beta-mannosidase